jgi:DNA-binding transcriptional LysR family regulator
MYDWAELRHFRYLLAILERGGFRAAAEHLNTVQPNLSVQAKQFQDHASIRLFQKRKNGRIRPTETGVAFLPLARLLLETRNEVIDALIAIERGEIRVARFGCAPLVDQALFRIFCSVHREILPYDETTYLLRRLQYQRLICGPIRRFYTALSMILTLMKCS